MMSSARFTVLPAGRRFGKSEVGVLWTGTKAQRARMSGQQGVIWIVYPTYKIATVAWRKFFNILPKGWITDSSGTDLHPEAIRFGPITLEFKSAVNPGKLVGEGLLAVWIDECGEVKERAWSESIRPMLMDYQAPALLTGCVSGESLVAVHGRGLVRIDDLFDAQDPVGQMIPGRPVVVEGRSGPRTSPLRWKNAPGPLKAVRLRTGITVRCTPEHPLWVMGDGGVPEWREAERLMVGDRVGVRRGAAGCGDGAGRDDITEDVAWLIGAIVGDGSVEHGKGRDRITITSADLGPRLLAGAGGLRWKAGYDGVHFRASSKGFVGRLGQLGYRFVRAPEKEIPAALLALPRERMAALLRGLFDTDGHCNTTGPLRVGLTSTSASLVEQVQQLLLNFGIVARQHWHVSKPTAKAKVSSRVCQLMMGGENARLFMREIGFSIERKRRECPPSSTRRSKDEVPQAVTLMRQVMAASRVSNLDAERSGQRVDNISHRVKDGGAMSYANVRGLLRLYSDASHAEAYKRLNELCSENLYWDTVASVEESKGSSYDLNVPDGHAYTANGVVSHNTPKSINWFQEIYRRGWEDGVVTRSFGLNPLQGHPTSGNPWIKGVEIEMAKAEATDRVFRQEYLAEFLGDEGAVFRGIKDARDACGGLYSTNPTAALGVDLGKRQDWTVIVGMDRDGWVTYFDRFNNIDWVTQKAKITEAWKRFDRPWVVMDSTGIGDPIVDDLRWEGMNIEPYLFTGKSKVPLVEGLVIALEQRRIKLPDEPVLINELVCFEYSKLPGGGVRYAAPDDKHDDCVMALALAWKGAIRFGDSGVF